MFCVVVQIKDYHLLSKVHSPHNLSEGVILSLRRRGYQWHSQKNCFYLVPGKELWSLRSFLWLFRTILVVTFAQNLGKVGT